MDFNFYGIKSREQLVKKCESYIYKLVTYRYSKPSVMPAFIGGGTNSDELSMLCHTYAADDYGNMHILRNDAAWEFAEKQAEEIAERIW